MTEETIISDLYQTKIELTDYDVNIDDEIDITVTLLDFENNPVSGESVNLYANGDVIKSANTDRNGQITANYTCNEWGLITFSANESVSQVHVRGWRSKQVLGDTGGVATLYVNEDTGLARLSYLLNPGPKIDVTSGSPNTFDNLKVDAQNTNQDDFIDNKYLPATTVKGIVTVPYITVSMSSNGTLGYFSTESRSAGSVAIGVDFMWNI